MFGFGYALVPLYNLMCDLTGLNGKTQRVSVAGVQHQKVNLNRNVTVEFTTEVNTNLPWQFKALQKKIIVHPGQLTTAKFMARNMTNKVITAQAIPSVAPSRAAGNFKKFQCFCFTQQTLQPGEEKEMVVQFMVEDKLAPDIGIITLAYTFFNSNLAKKVGSGDGQQIKVAHKVLK